MKQFLIAITILLFASTAYGADKTLSWDASDNAEGYKIQMSTDMGQTRDASVEVENVTTLTSPAHYNSAHTDYRATNSPPQEYLQSVSEGTGFSPAPNPNKVQRMRFFVPPGTERMSLRYDMYWGDYVAMVVRWGQPPSCKRCEQIQTKEDYINFDFDSSNLSLLDYKENDKYLQNNGAYITILSGGVYPINQNPGWLYVNIFYRERYNSIIAYNYSVKVKNEIYEQWYNTTLWDKYGNPPYRITEGHHIIEIDQPIYLILNAEPQGVQEWLAFWMPNTPVQFFIPNKGIFPYSLCYGWPDIVSYDFPVREIKRFNDTYFFFDYSILCTTPYLLGLSRGDTITYLYAFSTTHIDNFTEMDNIEIRSRVDLTVQ